MVLHIQGNMNTTQQCEKNVEEFNATLKFTLNNIKKECVTMESTSDNMVLYTILRMTFWPHPIQRNGQETRMNGLL